MTVRPTATHQQPAAERFDATEQRLQMVERREARTVALVDRNHRGNT